MARPTHEVGPTLYASRNYVTSEHTNDTYTLHPWIRDERNYTGSVTVGYKGLKHRQRTFLKPLAHHVDIYRRWGTAFTEYTYTKYGSSIMWSSNIYSCIIPVTTFPSVAHVDQAYTLARARLADKTNKMSMNVGQFFGERRQTIKLIADNATRIVSLARAIKHVDVEGVRSALGTYWGKVQLTHNDFKRFSKTRIDKRISNHWLEFTYGWKPLLQDIYGAADLIARHANQDRYNTRSVASGKAKAKYHAKDTYSTVDYTRETKVKFGMHYGLDSEARAGLAQTGIDNPALLAWELTPYSFVVDWFLPVGNYLEALNAFSGFSFIDGFVSYSTQQECHIDRNRWLKTTYGYYTSSGDAYEHKGLYDRYVLTSFPSVGKLAFKSPFIDSKTDEYANQKRFLTAYSLMRVLFK